MNTVIPDIDATNWAERLVSLFPDPWVSDDAKQPGGVLYSLFKAIGDDLERTIDNVEYGRKTSRIEEAVDSGLDSVAADFFGPVAGFAADVARVPGEPDESLRNRIKGSLLLPAATRQSLIDLLFRLTGDTPRVMEPWSPQDTACWDHINFFNIDTVENPSRLGDPGLKWQGFVEAVLPSYGNQGDNPVYAFDKGICWDAASGFFIDPKATWWLQVARIDALINKTKIYGTTVWRRYRGSPLTKVALGGTLNVSLNAYEREIEVFPAFAGLYSVLANANWNTSVTPIIISNNKFKLVFSNAAPPDAKVDWNATPLILGGTGIGPVQEDEYSATIGIQTQFANHVLMVAPNWNTPYWLHSKSPTLATVKFANTAPQSATIAYKFFDPAQATSVIVPAGATDITVPNAFPAPFQVFAMPTWNTWVEIDRGPYEIRLTFPNPPDTDSLVFVAINQS